MKLRVLVLIGAALFLVAADAPRGDTKKEVDQLQGTWKAVTIEQNGKAVTGQVSKDFRLIVTGDKAALKSRVNDQFTDATYQLKVDPTTEPKSLDLVPVSETAPERTVRGVYQLDKDVLKLRLSKPGAKRPPGFTLPADTDTTLFVLQRETP
jgi:uncharacterized protein (TIGR03067 family)